MQKPEARWNQHVKDADRGSALFFGRAIRKYGPDAFSHEILHNEIDNPDELDRLEVAAIAACGTLAPRGYNMTTGGSSYRLEGEALRRLSEGQKQVWSDPAYRERQSEKMKAVWEDPQYRERHAVARSHLFSDPIFLSNLSKGMKKSWADPEKKKARVAAMIAAMPENVGELRRAEQLKRWAKPGTREAQSVRSQKLAADPAYIEKLSASIRRVCSTPEESARRSDRNRQRWTDPEKRAKQSAALIKAKASLTPSVLVEGVIFQSIGSASRATEVGAGTVANRLRSRMFKWWFKLPHHRDPECDAVEECWALMQWAAANRVHANVPEWLRPDRPRHGVAPAWAKRAAA